MKGLMGWGEGLGRICVAGYTYEDLEVEDLLIRTNERWKHGFDR